jgi:hypothetical protein
MKTIFIVALTVAACSVEHPPQQSSTADLPDSTAAAFRDDSVICAPSVGARNVLTHDAIARRTVRGTPHKDSIVSAVRAAYGLEHKLYDSTGTFESRDAVLANYRRGFSESMAQRLTDYSWSKDSSVLRCCREAALVVPDSVVVVSKNDTAASVVYPTPSFLQDRWGFEPYTADQLRRCDGRWVITSSKDFQKRPRELDIPPAA